MSDMIEGEVMLVGDHVKLRPKRLEDALQDYRWRQDLELSELDASAPLDESFEEYQQGYAWEMQHPARHRRRFSIETLKGRHVGNISYFDIEEGSKEAQLGIMIGDRDYWGRGYGAEAVRLLLDYIFMQNGLESVHLRTLDWNFRAQRCFGKCGFVPVGRLKEGYHDFIIMRVTRLQWNRLNEGPKEDKQEQKVNGELPGGG